MTELIDYNALRQLGDIAANIRTATGNPDRVATFAQACRQYPKLARAAGRDANGNELTNRPAATKPAAPPADDIDDDPGDEPAVKSPGDVVDDSDDPPPSAKPSDLADDCDDDDPDDTQKEEISDDEDDDDESPKRR